MSRPVAAHRGSFLARVAAPAIFSLLTATPILSQTTGTISGQVVAAGTEQPVTSAQLTVAGTSRGARTDERGTFRITDVSSGRQVLAVRALGHAPATQPVVVVAGAEVRVRIVVSVSAATLDQVVVTGQGTATSRREIGTSIATINVEELETAPITSTSQLLQSRVPGVTILPGGGNAGQGSSILLRGPGSLEMGSEPLIYVDGIRIDNSSFVGFAGGGRNWSGLDDINPAEIERIEIIRGAAAATLYGTEASAGVIQIFTKQGKGRPQQWVVSSEYGHSRVPLDYWDVSAYSKWFYDTFAQTGQTQSHNVAVRGSADQFSYNVSGNFRGVKGVLPNSDEGGGSFRANMRFSPFQKFALDVNTGYSRRGVQQPQATSLYGYSYNSLLGGPAGIFTPPMQARLFETIQNSSRFTAGAKVEYAPTANLTSRVTLGVDALTSDQWDMTPFEGRIFPRRYNYRRAATSLTLDAATTYQRQLTAALRSRTTGGFQAFDNDDNFLNAVGSGYPGPVTVVGALSNRTAGERRQQSRTAGFFLEEQLAFRERLFVTLGARADGHSAFGSDFKYVMYPKADISWVVSEYSFWPASLGTLRLRSAYGEAGRQPATFAALRTWTTVRSPTGSGFIPLNVGNPDLRPEVTREIEGGFDLGLLRDRVTLTFNLYDQRTRDALYSVVAPPSEGFIASQQENVATVTNRGVELGTNFRLIDRSRLRWNARVNYSNNENSVPSLGTANPRASGIQYIREGYPFFSFFADRFIVQNGAVGRASDLLRRADGTLPEGWDYIGSPFPKHNFSAGSDLTLAKIVTLSALLDFKGGHFLYSGTTRDLANKVVSKDVQLHGVTLKAGTPIGTYCQTQDPLLMRVCATDPKDVPGNHVHSADGWRLREVSASLALPSHLAARFRARSARVSLSGRNLWRSQKYIGLDAEASYFDAPSARFTFFDTPLPKTIVARIAFEI